jgi:hypothetical protein
MRAVTAASGAVRAGEEVLKKNQKKELEKMKSRSSEE